MSRPMTMRLPDELLREIEEQARSAGLGRAAYMRKLIRRGLAEERTNRALAGYVEGRLSAGQVCEMLDLSTWELPNLLRANDLHRNVTFEDWLDSAGLIGD